MDLLLKLLLAPTLIVLVTLVQRRFGHAVGGRLAALPLVSGPFVIVIAAGHGIGAAQDAATGILAGATGGVVFFAAYAHLAAARFPRRVCLPLATLACAVALFVVGGIAPPPWVSLVFVGVALLATLFTWPSAAPTPPPVLPDWELPTRAAVAAGVVFALALATSTVGAGVAGVLTGFPAPAAVLFALTHRGGRDAVVVLGRGLAVGAPCSALFYSVLALGLGQLPTLACFLLAGLAAIATQVVIQLPDLAPRLRLRIRPGRA